MKYLSSPLIVLSGMIIIGGLWLKSHETKPPTIFQLRCAGSPYILKADKWVMGSGGCIDVFTRTGYQPSARLCGCDLVVDVTEQANSTQTKK